MMQEDHGFDFETAWGSKPSLERYSGTGKPLLGKEGSFTPLTKNLTEASLEGELDLHLGQEFTATRLNGKSQKKVKSLNGNF